MVYTSLRSFCWCLFLGFFMVSGLTNKLQAQADTPISVIHFDELDALMAIEDDTLRVINFWATWCAPCVKELPYFEQLGTTYANKALKVYLISLDDVEKLDRVTAFRSKRQLQQQVLLLDEVDYNAWINRQLPDWSGAIPATVILQNTPASNHKPLRFFHEGELDYAALERIVKPRL